MNYYLGIDWGKRKIGVATADDETRMVFAHATWDSTQSIPKICALVEELHVSVVVIGVPTSTLHNNDASGARAFGAQLAQEIPSVMICYCDEMFTTQQAQRDLAQANKKTRTHDDDAQSAQILLQSWLDMTDAQQQKCCAK